MIFVALLAQAYIAINAGYTVITGQKIYPLNPWTNLESSAEAYMGFNLGILVVAIVCYQLFIFRLKKESHERGDEELYMVLSSATSLAINVKDDH